MHRQNDKFTMSEPKPFKGLGANYAFWLTTSEQALVEFVKTVKCVAFVSNAGNPPLGKSTAKTDKDDISAQPLRVLVAVNDDFDADEAWHWIFKELNDEASFVQLDSIWEDAIKGVL